jgi:dipeptidyl aminopeptidase/acylaminoacyl peptidase
MQKDIRETALFREAEALNSAIRRPGSGLISDAADLHVSPDGQRVVYAGALVEKLEGVPQTRICETDIDSGQTRVLTFGPHSDRLPKYSPDGRLIAFLSDRLNAGDFQLCILNAEGGSVRSVPIVEGWVEFLQWSPDGQRLLLGVAGRGADLSGKQGARSSTQAVAGLPSWVPNVETGNEDFRWRSAWIYQVAAERMHRVDAIAANIWEAVWCGNTEIAAVYSNGPGEGHWYEAHLAVINIDSGKRCEMYVPKSQLGCLAACSSGRHLAFVEATCSDRGLVAGDLQLIDTTSGELTRVDSANVDITYAEWRSDKTLLVAGHRGFETVVGSYEPDRHAFTETWSSDDLSAGWPFVAVAGINESADCLLVAESFVRSPEIAGIRAGTYSAIKSFDLGYSEHARVLDCAQRLIWAAEDGLEVQGWLLKPTGDGPFPLVMNVHGGPVWHWRPLWLGRSNTTALMLLRRGFAVFLPNPRGSSGRGQPFTRHVLGEMGGADTQDLLSGLDYLVEQKLADPGRLGVMGGSYGGFMSAWLITQDSRFAAAVPVSPFTNPVSEQLASNIPHCMRLFLGDSYTNPTGKYFQRSAVMHANRARTPTLNICGALDRCTPPQEAMQFHNALLENGVESVLLTYPEEGHGVRSWPASMDYAARVVDWFERKMPGNQSNL